MPVAFDNTRFGPDLIELHGLAKQLAALSGYTADLTVDPELLGSCAQVLERLAAETGLPFVTRGLADRGLKPSDPRFRDYYQSAPERPFCQTYIEPKLATLRDRHKRLLRQEHLPS
jgi:peptide-methionine (S)-S-oxide reductase